MFEKSWKKAFEQAEVSPSDSVWTNIELELEKARGAKLRRRLFFYQGLAAAAVFFALVIGIGVFVADKNALHSNPQITADLNQIPAKTNQAGVPTESPEKQSLSRDDQAALIDATDPSSVQQKTNIVSGTADGSNTKEHPTGNDPLIKKSHSELQNQNLIALEPVKDHSGKKIISSSTDQQPAIAKASRKNGDVAQKITSGVNALPSEEYLAFSDPRLPPLVEQRQPQLVIRKQEETIADPVALMLARLDAREKELSEEDRHEKKTNKNENIWTSLGFSAGSFNPAIARVSASPGASASAPASFTMAYDAVNKSIANEQAKASGMAYTMGMNVGKKIAERWIMQGGINYLSQSADYTARYGVTDQNLSKFRPPNINELANFAVSASSASSDKLVATAPYNVNNNVHYLSVPVQAGYLVINRKLGWQVNAGLSTDVFLQNTVTADVQNTDLGNGSSPYRQLNVSGLMGTELSYRFAGHYRIALNPGLRYPFGNIYKSESIRVNPLTFDIGLRLRYIFH